MKKRQSYYSIMIAGNNNHNDYDYNDNYELMTTCWCLVNTCNNEIIIEMMIMQTQIIMMYMIKVNNQKNRNHWA